MIRGLACVALLLAILPYAQQGANQPRDSGGQERLMQRSRDEQRRAPRVGDIAPRATLKTLDGKREVDVNALRGKRPVILFFGSYT